MQTDVKYELENLRPNLFIQETEDSWEKIAKALLSLIKLCENGAYDTNPTDLVGAIKAAHRPIISAMNSERTRLCLVPMDLMGSLATAMGMDFEQMLPLFMPPLLTNCARTNKIVINRAKTSILTIIEVSQPASVLTYFLQNIKDKSASMKVAISEGTLACLNSCNPPDVEKEARAVEIEGIIRTTARDANADVRKLSRKMFESYTMLLPSRVKSFTAPLSPTTKKYLDIKTTAATSAAPIQKSSSSLHSNANLRPEIKSKPSAGPSSSNATSRQTHSRTTSSTTLSTATNPSQMRSQPTTVIRRKEPTAPAEAAAPYVPVRPVQPSRVVSESHKTVPQRSTHVAATRTTAIQEEKRPVPPLRTQRSVISRTVQGPTSSGAPHRVPIAAETKPIASSASQALPSTGPRRIPMPPPPPPAPKKEAEGPKRPASRVDNASSSSLRPVAVPAAPIKKKPASTLSSSLRDRVQASTSSTNHTRTKSSAVASDAIATSTSATAASGSVKPIAVANAKPLWGRSAPSAKAVPSASHKAPVKAAMPVVKKPSSRAAPAPKSTITSGVPTKKLGLVPEMVALPPSPPPTQEDVIVEAEVIAPIEEAVFEPADVEENAQNVITECISAIPSEVPSVDVVEAEEDVEETDHAATNDGDEEGETVLSSTTDTTAVYPSSINNKENIPIPEIQAAIKADEVSEDDDDSSSMVLPTDENPQTPQQGLMPFPSVNAAAGKTPISALLSSIERGFKYDYSPITPLSPADSYLPNINGATPYSHHTHAPHIKGPMQPFNHALHAPGHSGIFGGLGGVAKHKEELVRGDIGVVQLSEYNKLYMATGLPVLDDGRQTFIELNKN